MTTMTKASPVEIEPANSTGSAVLGANSQFEPAQHITINLSSAAEAYSEVAIDEPAESATGTVLESAAHLSKARAQHSADSHIAWTQAGFASLADSQPDEAIASFRRALELRPGDRGALLGSARASFEKGDAAAAVSLLRDLIERDSNDMEARVSLAVVLSSLGSADEALEVLPERIDFRPEWASVFAVRGGIHFMLGHNPQAISDLRKAIRLRPDSVQPRNLLGLAELRAGKASTAERHFREAVRIAPMHEGALPNLVQLLRSQGRWEDVLSEIERYWSPGSASVVLSQFAGEAALELCIPRLARTWLEPVRGKGHRAEQNAALLNNLGVAYMQLGLVPEAGVAFAEATAAAPTDVSIANRAKVLIAQGEAGAAAEWLARVMSETGVAGPATEATLGAALAAAGDYESALNVGRRAIERADANEAVFGLMSYLLTDVEGTYEEAYRVCQEGLRRWPQSLLLRNNMAYALLMAGRVDEAQTLLDSIDWEALPKDHLAYLTATRGLSEMKRGDIPSGQRLYETALKHALTPAIGDRIKAKRDLEMARALIQTGNPRPEITKLLQRAAAAPASAEPYASHARIELKRLGPGSGE